MRLSCTNLLFKVKDTYLIISINNVHICFYRDIKIIPTYMIRLNNSITNVTELKLTQQLIVSITMFFIRIIQFYRTVFKDTITDSRLSYLYSFMQPGINIMTEKL